MSLHEADERTIGNQLLEARRWARALLFDDWGLKLLALGITLALWYVVMSGREPAAIRLRGIELVYLLPDGMDISNEPRDEVQVTLRGSRQALDALNIRNMVASVNLRDHKIGERVVQLAPERVTMELPDGVQIEKIEPGTVPLRLEQSIEREIEVRAQFDGELPVGYKLHDVQITPSKIRVRGPESHVSKLEQALTEPISFEGRTESFSDTQIAVVIPDKKVAALDAVVNVRIEIVPSNEN